jgi:hypothetical protein
MSNATTEQGTLRPDLSRSISQEACHQNVKKSYSRSGSGAALTAQANKPDGYLLCSYRIATAPGRTHGGFS